MNQAERAKAQQRKIEKVEFIQIGRGVAREHGDRQGAQDSKREKRDHIPIILVFLHLIRPLSTPPASTAIAKISLYQSHFSERWSGALHSVEWLRRIMEPKLLVGAFLSGRADLRAKTEYRGQA